jgi:hypothetical protein
VAEDSHGEVDGGHRKKDESLKRRKMRRKTMEGLWSIEGWLGKRRLRR